MASMGGPIWKHECTTLTLNTWYYAQYITLWPPTHPRCALGVFSFSMAHDRKAKKWGIWKSPTSFDVYHKYLIFCWLLHLWLSSTWIGWMNRCQWNQELLSPDVRHAPGGTQSPPHNMYWDIWSRRDADIPFALVWCQQRWYAKIETLNTGKYTRTIVRWVTKYRASCVFFSVFFFFLQNHNNGHDFAPLSQHSQRSLGSSRCFWQMWNKPIRTFCLDIFVLTGFVWHPFTHPDSIVVVFLENLVNQ